MEKMNQVSVTDFMSKSKEEMYDMAVEMVEKYNRLVDLCNDSAERMADLITRHKTYTSALNNDIADRDAKIEKLEKEIEKRKNAFNELSEKLVSRYIPIDEHNDICEAFEEKVETLKKELEHRKSMSDDENCLMNSLYDEIARRTEKINELTIKVANQKKNLDGINKTLDIRNKENESLIQVRNNQTREIEAHEAENARLSDIIKNLRASNEKLKKENSDYAIRVNNLTEELEKTYAEKEADLKNHNRRDMNLVDELAGKNDKIKSLVEEIEQLKAENSYLKKECKNKNDVIRKAYVRYVDEACKGREEIMNECYKKLTKDDTGYQGFKQYTLMVLEAEKGKEETKKELNEAFGVPCGEDSIE
jgi:chromosome segregation ATPase